MSLEQPQRPSTAAMAMRSAASLASSSDGHSIRVAVTASGTPSTRTLTDQRVPLDRHTVAETPSGPTPTSASWLLEPRQSNTTRPKLRARVRGCRGLAAGVVVLGWAAPGTEAHAASL